MHSVHDSKDRANNPATRPFDQTIVREVNDPIARVGLLLDDGGNGGDDDDPPSSEPHFSGPEIGPPQFAIRIGDGAMMMAVNEYAHDRDLSGREVWLCFTLTPEEADSARKEMDIAEHAAATRIAFKLPRKP